MWLHVILLWITQQQHDGFTSPRNIWACALLQTSKKEQRLARGSLHPTGGILDEQGY